MSFPVRFSTDSPALVNLNKIIYSGKYCHIHYPCENNQTCAPIKATFRSGQYRIKLCGAKGGDHAGYSPGFTGVGGAGGCSWGKISFYDRQDLFLFVGGTGHHVRQDSNNQMLGGYNGGGKVNKNAGSGGGASDLRLDQNDLKSRIIIAGGGGGSNDATNGGTGGGFTGGDGLGTYKGFGGSQTQGGSHSNQECIGIFGQGGSIANTPSITDGGAGGGGYYGGSRGCGDTGSSGGGGSGYVSALEGCYSMSRDGNPIENSIHYSGFRFEEGGMSNGENLDNGFIEIAFVGAPLETGHKRMKAMLQKLIITGIIS